MALSPFYVKINGMAVAMRDADALEEAVRDALFQWYEAAECSHHAGDDFMCCENHPQDRFRPCSACHAVAKAQKDDQGWLESGTDMLPYKIQLPQNPGAARKTIEAWARV